ncbi:tetratricopeptide repeat protein [Rubritalea spongiae]|uniref:Tetratricopeptide repeat protein n=1 Tax=Rubritalea spongiae TaxID=430797 RepID=A0ABW5E3F1_9BACT
MRRTFLTYLSYLFLVLVPLSGLAEETEIVRPGTILLSAYQAISEAEKFEQQDQAKEAWNKYQQALRYYQSLSATHPAWKPHIVQGRIQSTSEAIKRVEPMAQKALLAEQSKLQDFVGSETSTLPSPSNPINQLPPSDLEQITKLNNRLNEMQANLEKLKNQHNAEKLELHQQISKLQTELRKQQQGLGAESTQSRMLNGEIARLQQELRRSQQLGQNDQQKLLDTIEELQRTRNALATAPLRADVEKLQKEKAKQEQELSYLAKAYQRNKKLLEIKTLENQQLQKETKLAKDQLAEKTKLLEQSETNTKAVVATMRNEIQNLKSKLAISESKRREQDGEIKALLARLSQSETIENELRDELANMTAERDQLSQMLKLSDADRAKELMKENLRLGKELSLAKRNLEQLHADKNAALDRVTQAETDVAIAKQQLIYKRKENIEFRKRISNLEATLANTRESLSSISDKPAVDEAAREEAELLKQTVKRLMAQAKRRQQAEKLLWNEYRRTALIDPDFVNEYEKLASEEVELTERERDMLTVAQSQGDLHFGGSNVDQQSHQIAQAKADERISTYHSIAKRWIEKDNLPVAKELYDEAYDSIPDYSFLVNRGVVRLKLGEYQEAEEIFELGATQRPRNPYTHFMLGMSRYYQQNDDLAAKSIDRAIDLKPDHKEAFLYRSIIEARNGRNQNALEFLTNAIELDPEYEEAYFNLAVLHKMMGNNTKAQKAYNDALKAGLAPNLEFEREIGINKARS